MDNFTVFLHFLSELSYEQMILAFILLIIYYFIKCIFHIIVVFLASKTPMKISFGKKFKLDTTNTTDQEIKINTYKKKPILKR